MFEQFEASFRADAWAAGPSGEWTAADTRALLGSEPRSFTEFFSRVARSSYNGGLLRFVLPNGDPALKRWNATGWSHGWRTYEGRLVVFAYDWLGSQIALDRQRVKSGEPAISILEPGTGKLLAVPQTFEGLITEELLLHTDAALATELYEAWRGAAGPEPRPRECIGYSVPLFLGGVDVPSNLEVWDLEAYLSITGQAWTQARHLRPGTRIRGLKFS